MKKDANNKDKKFEVNMQKELPLYLKDDLLQNFVWNDEFKMHSNLYLMEVSNRWGYLFILYGNCILCLEGTDIERIIQKGDKISDV